MGGGNRKVVQNYRERAVSNDVNRQQAIAARETGERLRFTAGVVPAAWELGGSLPAVLPSTIGTPLQADVYEGLVVMPQAGTLSLFVQPGLVCMYDPDGQAGSSDPAAPSTDDSAYKVVRSDGISALGTLLIAANPSGSPRIDLVECSRREATLETQMRDVFDPTLGTFASTSVTKVTAGELTFRVSQGTPGAGMPNRTQGWLPLAVVSAPAGATSVNAMTFWDVRPLVSDRVQPPSRAFHQFIPPHKHNSLYADNHSFNPTQLNVGGNFCAEVNGYWAGGRVRKGTPTAIMGNGDLDYVDIKNVENKDHAWAPAGNALWYLWLCFPFGLPRWVRYEETAIGQRLPWGMRGIPVVSGAGVNFDGTPAASIILPAATGLDPASASPVTSAVCMGAGCCSGGVPFGFIADGDWVYPESKPAAVNPSTASLSYDEYTLQPGVDFPGNARVVKVFIHANIAFASNLNSFRSLNKMHNATSNVAAVVWGDASTLVMVGGAGDFGFLIEIPRLPGGTDPLTYRLYWNMGAGPVKSDEESSVFGWRTQG